MGFLPAAHIGDGTGAGRSLLDELWYIHPVLMVFARCRNGLLHPDNH
jgi:hypothetical protein